jgi:hypothetical protein
MRAESLRSCLGCMALMLLLAGCGSDGSSTSGVDGSKKIIDLTRAEMGQFCDWAANKLGGYETCDEEVGFMSFPDKNACVDRDWESDCQASVKQAEACINSLHRCPTEEEAGSSSACSEITSCYRW